MESYRYEITRHDSSEFTQVVYFCSAQGDCALEHVPGDQVDALESLMNERGQAGWELIQIEFGQNGVLAFWKRRILAQESE